MPLPRKQQISLSDTPYYHCVSRCVRRAYLCGKDKLTGRSYEHRRKWVEDRLLFLSKVFVIDICAYAVMSNHTHVVLHVDVGKVNKLSDKNVLRRWHKLHRGTLLTQQYANNIEHTFSETEKSTLQATVEIYRNRLADISWFMRELNEPIARKANSEDNCTGHFWEGRFKSQALLDDFALAACMVYVDLNPVRAKVDVAPESSRHTSIKKRIRGYKIGSQPKALMPLVGGTSFNHFKGIDMDLASYIQLVNFTAQQFTQRVSSSIDSSQPYILQKLDIDPQSWVTYTTLFEATFGLAAGMHDSVTLYKRKIRQTHSAC